MAQSEDVPALHEEYEALAQFLRTLQAEYITLERDFAAVLRSLGGSVSVSACAMEQSSPPVKIERTFDSAMASIVFRLIPTKTAETPALKETAPWILD